MQAKKYNNYDPELKDLITKSGSISLAIEYGIPRNTARYWIEKAKTPAKMKLKTSKRNILKQEL